MFSRIHNTGFKRKKTYWQQFVAVLVNKMKYFQHPPAVVGPQYGYAPLSPGKTRYLY